MRTKVQGEPARSDSTAHEILDVVDVGRSFGNTLAVSNVSFTAKQNEIFALLGPNGSGKSTLLRMLCGFLQPSSGNISILGHSLLHAPREAKAALGYVPDEGGLYLHQSVRHFLYFVAGAKNIPSHERNDRLDDATNTLGLESVLDKKISTLSRGYRQRVSLAQALLNRPKIIFMDEPTNGLDPTQVRVWRDIMNSVKQNCTIIFTSHVLEEVSLLADRVGLLIDGRLVSVESLERNTSDLLLKIKKDGLHILEGHPLANIEAVTELEQGILAVTVRISDCPIPQLITELVNQGLQLHEMSSAQADLEALYFQAAEKNSLQGRNAPDPTRYF